MTYEWKEAENRHTIIIGGFCVILYEEEWTLGMNTGEYVARCSGIGPDPFRIMERTLDAAKEAALRQILAHADTQLFNLQAFHDNVTMLLGGKGESDGSV